MTDDFRQMAEALAGLGPLTGRLTPAEEVAGGPPRPAIFEIHAEPGRAWRGYFHIASPDIPGGNAVLGALCALVRDVWLLASQAQDACAARDAARAARRAAESKLAHTLRGGRLFGQALVRVTDSGVWLLDPHKQEAGFGLHFRSLGALWREMPDLRPIEWGEDFLIVESFALVE